MTIQHTKAHFIRAAMEGVIFSMYSIAKVLKEQHEVHEIYASGGFAKSTLWLQILADVSDIKVVVSETVESSALGAVMLGAEALGLEMNIEKAAQSTYEPNQENCKVYARQFDKFERLYKLLKDEMVNDLESR